MMLLDVSSVKVDLATNIQTAEKSAVDSKLEPTKIDTRFVPLNKPNLKISYLNLIQDSDG